MYGFCAGQDVVGRKASPFAARAAVRKERRWGIRQSYVA
jgi:hypothetical protein